MMMQNASYDEKNTFPFLLKVLSFENLTSDMDTVIKGTN